MPFYQISIDLFILFENVILTVASNSLHPFCGNVVPILQNSHYNYKKECSHSTLPCTSFHEHSVLSIIPGNHVNICLKIATGLFQGKCTCKTAEGEETCSAVQTLIRIFPCMSHWENTVPLTRNIEYWEWAERSSYSKQIQVN